MKNWRTTQPFSEDFRKMLDKLHKKIDAVVVSTPDHNIWQARTLLNARERYKVVTQMGNQGHAGDGIRQSVEAYRAGVIGDVSDVYCRNDGPEMGGRILPSHR